MSLNQSELFRVLKTFADAHYSEAEAQSPPAIRSVLPKGTQILEATFCLNCGTRVSNEDPCRHFADTDHDYMTMTMVVYRGRKK